MNNSLEVVVLGLLAALYNLQENIGISREQETPRHANLRSIYEREQPDPLYPGIWSYRRRETVTDFDSQSQPPRFRSFE